MALDRLFAESILNRDDHVVLGRRLLPLSLWHLLMLEIAQSPYFAGGYPTPKDLRLAVTICTTPFPRLPDLSGRRLIRDWLRSWRCLFPVEAAKFRAYLQDFNALPMLWTKEATRRAGAREPVGLPWTLAIVANVCGSTGWSAETVWNMPMGQAYWYHVAFCMQKGGDVDLLSEGEMPAVEQVKARRQRTEAGGQRAEGGR